MSERKKLVIIDGSSYIYRAYHALPKLKNTKGRPTGAIYGFVQMLKKVLRDMNADFVAMVYDPKGGSFRNDIYDKYKATRDAMPEDLVSQLGDMKKLVELLGIPALEKHGFEADDVIATIAKHAKNDFEVLVISSDKDLFQVVDEHVKLIDTMKDKTIGIGEVKERFGVEPARVAEVLGLAGDTSDNIPGIPGIGEKTARELIEQFGTIEGVLQNIDKISGKKRKENLENFAEQARLSKRLVLLDENVPIDIDLAKLKPGERDSEKLAKLLAELEFYSLIETFGLKAPQDERPTGESKASYKLVLDKNELSELVAKLEKAEWIAFDTETDSTDAIRARLVGMSFCADSAEAFYIPIDHRYLGVPDQLDLETIKKSIAPIFENRKKKFVAQNAKYDVIVCGRHGMPIPKVDFDTMVAGYVVDPSRHRHNINVLAEEYLQRRMGTYEEVVGKGVKAKSFGDVNVEEARDYSCDDANVTFELRSVLDGKLRESEMWNIFSDIEMPLVPVLTKMETNGVKIDSALLKKIGDELSEEMGLMLEKLKKTAGMNFNPNSPKQLGEVLFDVLGLPVLRKTATGRSTDQDVLEELALLHELPAMVLEYRSISKIKGTYADALPKLVNPETGRIHTSFNQTVASTGRLSSSDPNLQNIPVRSGVGLRIREAFIAEPGFALISADYNQIELRILAHLSKDETLLQSFARSEDIHRRTASELFDVKPEDVTKDQRRIAKVVIFGIAYGMSPFGLAKNLRIPREEAKKIHDRYFERYPKVKEYMEINIAEAGKKGYITTLHGRRLRLPEINSKNRNIRMNAERSAVNAPMQGTAADIIKMAMIKAQKYLDEKHPNVKMILQVHDELVFEVPEKNIAEISAAVKKIMESVEKLDVPLTADVGSGKNWSEAH